MDLTVQATGRCTYSTKKIIDIGQPSPTSHPEVVQFPTNFLYNINYIYLIRVVLIPFQLLREGEITPGISSEEYALRRKKFLELLPEKSLAILAAAPVKMMTDVVPYTFRQDADYSYITGCQQPGGVAVLGHDFGLCMFMPEPSTNVRTPFDLTLAFLV